MYMKCNLISEFWIPLVWRAYVHQEIIASHDDGWFLKRCVFLRDIVLFLCKMRCIDCVWVK